MAEQPAGPSPDFDVRDVINGVALLASTANVVMQLARPAVGYGVVESRVESGQVMRHPFRRIRKTVTYLSVAFMGTSEERQICRREVNRSHAGVRSTAGSPVSYSAFDPRLQLWVAACLYRGVIDIHTLLHGPVDDATAEAIYRESWRLGTTLHVPEEMWPVDRTAFERYWDSALTEIRIDPPVRDYLYRLMMLEYLPRPFSTAPVPDHRVSSPAVPRAHAASLDRIRAAAVRIPHADNRVGQRPAATAGLPVPVQRLPAGSARADHVEPQMQRRDPVTGAARGTVRITQVLGRAGYGEQDLRVARVPAGKAEPGCRI
jgi:uncharacterized protein (DUF2236 family)